MITSITSFFIAKSRRQIWALLLSAGLILACCPPSPAGPAKAEESAPGPGILVKYRDSEQPIKKLHRPGRTPEAELDYYNALDPVEYAEANRTYRAAIIPSDTYFDNQWYLEKIKARQAWDTVRESPEIVIAVIDSGVDIDHPDLVDNIWTNEKEIPDNGLDDDNNGYIDDINGWDFVNNQADPNPKFLGEYTEDGILHGTIVAGIAAGYGNNGTGISGVTWRARIMPLKVLDDAGSGETIDVIKAIDYAVAQGADIVNLSFVGFESSRSLEEAIRRAYNSGLLIVAAAGNDQNQGSGINTGEKPIYPACHDGQPGENMVIGVSATDALDQKADFASYGEKCIDIAAPGVSIFSTILHDPGKGGNGRIFNRYYDGYWSGTSMAAPMVSGALALLETLNPALGQKEVAEVLVRYSDNIDRLNPDYINQLGRGRLNVFRSVQEAKRRLDKNRLHLLTVPFSAAPPRLEILDNQDAKLGFLAYSERFSGGVRLAACDIEGDGLPEIITAPGPGGGPHIRIFDINGNLKGQFFAYEERFRGGVNIACADVDGNGGDEIISAPAGGLEPEVRVFTARGDLTASFMAYSPRFLGGVHVAAADIDNDSRPEIVTGAGPGGGPQVRIFSAGGLVEGQFFAYDERFRGGVRVDTINIGKGSLAKKADIVTAPGPGGGPHIRIFDNRARLKGQFFAYGERFRGGVSLATADVDYDGLEEIITGAGPGGSPHVRTFDFQGRLIDSFFALEQDFTGGVSVEAIYISN